MKSRKGFTLTELLAVIVIIGIISLFSWPALDNVVESSTMSKFTTYGDSMIAAAKVYVDSYEEDLFQYEEDLEAGRREKGQCAHIPLQELIEHSFIKDYNFDDMTCLSDGSFVQVIRTKGKYKYSYFLGCGNKKDAGASGKLDVSKITKVVPQLPKGSSQSYYISNSAMCNSRLTGVTLSFDTNGGTSCSSKVIYPKYGEPLYLNSLCSPKKANSVFQRWVDSTTGETISDNSIVTSNINLKAIWRKYEVRDSYRITGGDLLEHAKSITEDDGQIYYNGSETIHHWAYDDITSNEGLSDYNNGNFIRIGKLGYHAVLHQEWKVVSVKRYDQSTNKWIDVAPIHTTYDDHAIYNASELCDASLGDCVVTFEPNWSTTLNKISVRQNANGGHFAESYCQAEGCSSLELDENENFVVNGSNILRTVTYGGKMNSAGLFNWDWPNYINIRKDGYHCKNGAEWNTKPDGMGQSFNDSTAYSFNQLKPYCHMKDDYSTSCDPNYNDCYFTVYANWEDN